MTESEVRSQIKERLETKQSKTQNQKLPFTSEPNYQEVTNVPSKIKKAQHWQRLVWSQIEQIEDNTVQHPRPSVSLTLKRIGVLHIKVKYVPIVPCIRKVKLSMVRTGRQKWNIETDSS